MTKHDVNGTTYRLPGELNEFQTALYLHLIDWKWRNLTREPGVHRHKGRDIEYDAILPAAMKDEWQPVYRPVVDRVKDHHRRFPFRQHQFIGHMASSQAACLNLFVPLLAEPALAAEVLRTVKPDMHEIAVDQLDQGFRIEYWADDGTGKGLLGDHSAMAGTDSDIAIAYRDAQGRLKLWMIEHKLSEPDFTSCGGAVSRGRTDQHRCRPAADVLQNHDLCYYHQAERCRYAYWTITDRHPEVFPCQRLATGVACPFMGGMNQLWRNMLMALAIEEQGQFAGVHFSVTYHPRNGAEALHQAVADFKVLTGNTDRFSVFTPDALLRAPAMQRSETLRRWADWYRGLYWYD